MAGGRRAHGQPDTGTVYDVKRFAVHDGPGIRTTVFLKGCPLRCLWCHNPEGMSHDPEPVYAARECIGCAECLAACPQGVHRLEDGRRVMDRTRCLGCGACADACFSGALRLAGTRMTTDGIMGQVLQDRAFYERSGGGMTLSGGEPLAQYGFTRALLRAARNAGLHTAVDTCAFAPWDRLEKLLARADLVLCDLKHMDATRHQELTGVSNEQILENIRRLDAAGQPMWVRVPLIPGQNDEESNYHALGAFLSRLERVERIEILRYHPLAESKYASIGRTYALDGLEPPSEGEAELPRRILFGYGLSQTVVR